MSRQPDHVEQAATALLLEQRLYSLRIDPMRLAHERPIRFDTFENYCALTRMTMEDLTAGGGCIDGLTVRFTRGGALSYIVLYRGGADGKPRRRFTLAHELGHIYLGHQDDGCAEEREANRFAASLLAPRVLVHAMHKRSGGALSAVELAEIFGVSRTVAELRLRSLRTGPRFTAEDLALLDKLGGFFPDHSGPLVTV